MAALLRSLNLAQYDGAAAVPGLNRNHLHTIPVRIPDPEVQACIAAIVRAFDNLIESNRRRIQLLEEMARTIYREWFVDFRYPGHKYVSVVDSALGPIPEGWCVYSFSEIVKYHIGGGWGAGERESGFDQPAFVVRGTDIPRVIQSDVSTVPYRFHSESNLRSRKLEMGDIVFEVSGGSKGQPVGRTLLVQQSLLDNFSDPVMCASFCKLIRVDAAIVEPAILIRLLQDSYARGELDSYQVQSTGITNFKWKPFLEHFRVVLPSISQQKEFVKTLEALNDLIANAGRTVGVLSRMRDILLPKLVTGQIDVSTIDLDALVEG